MFSSGFIGSDFFLGQNPEQSCGLARYKSAPGSFLAALLDSNNDDGDESEAFFAALLSGDQSTKSRGGRTNSNNHHAVKQEESPEPRPGYESAVSGGGGCIVGSYSVGMETLVNNGAGPNLARQTSSPAGFFNGFGVVGEVGNYRVHKLTSSPSSPNNNGLSNQINFSSSTTRFMPTIPENGHNPESGQLRNDGGGDDVGVGEFETVFPHDPWNESAFSGGLKRNRDGEMRMISDFNCLDNRSIGGNRKASTGLAHHLSLPRTSSEMADVENFLQFQTETVPCQVRAKRGCATHPRSIAERMRRTRISEKMKKLQDLFPNMDKQTSTADMLDLAVEYIKDLQKQVETLAETKARCICSSKPRL